MLDNFISSNNLILIGIVEVVLKFTVIKFKLINHDEFDILK
jgi:hypothetical protein